MPTHEVKNISTSTEGRKTAHGKIELIDIQDLTIARFVLQKGWKWSTEIKPLVKTDWCEAPHMQYMISGRYHIKLRDGTEYEIGPGDVSFTPPGHDAWVVGDEPAVGIEFVGGRIATGLPKKP